jgi:N-acetylglucosamine-6-phosphate deacetylase
MPLAGTPDGEGTWEGTPIRVEGGKAVRVADGTIIGGVITLEAAMRNAVQYLGAPLHDAVAMASAVPDAVLSRRQHPRHTLLRGALEAGRRADLVLLDDELRVTETWVGGVRVYDHQPRASSD